MNYDDERTQKVVDAIFHLKSKAESSDKEKEDGSGVDVMKIVKKLSKKKKAKESK